jgi:hypothetical protein
VPLIRRGLVLPNLTKGRNMAKKKSKSTNLLAREGRSTERCLVCNSDLIPEDICPRCDFGRGRRVTGRRGWVPVSVLREVARKWAEQSRRSGVMAWTRGDASDFEYGQAVCAGELLAIADNWDRPSKT